jgi:hypothetical protein
MSRPPIDLDDIPELMDLEEAATAVLMHPMTLRKAIRLGELEASIPRGREPLKAGRGQGYRITRAALSSWYFNTPKEASQ